MFSQSQIEDLLKTVRYQNVLFSAENIGSDILFDEDKELLREFGIDFKKDLDEDSLMEESYKFGILSEALGDSRSKDMTYEQFNKFLESGNFTPLTDAEEETLNFIKKNTYHYIKSLSDKEEKDLSSILLQEERINKLKDVLVEGVEYRKSVKEISLKLREVLDKRQVDFDRIAETEMNSAFQMGRAMSILKKYGKGALVYKDVYPGACQYCIKLYLTDGIGSEPRVFTIEELLTNGTNIGRKNGEWKAVVESTHPHCRCTLNNVPQNKSWDKERKSFSKLEKYVPRNQRKSKVGITYSGKKYEV